MLHVLGYKEGKPFQFNLFRWLPESLTVKAVQGLLRSRFADVAFAQYDRASRDEMRQLADEFGNLVRQTSIATPNIDLLKGYLD